ncbi:aminopeptidase [Allosaccharopolyspora coralli]|uniref:Aminopeptidase n=1 Tax=Allosaccharopolyspora coralli TaxID=2665642 RepID=A0A5Q3QI57_9PSEU|nr:neutral zinc metallopeptidase [Allosaccharopolyspora coralli]QGK71139.1 aminopeptidase [Allosaccharopolyspora coralli]
MAAVPAHRRRKRIAVTVLAALGCVSLIAGCARTIAGTPAAAERASTTDVAGLPAANGPSGPKPGVPDADLTVENSDGGPMDGLARNAVADVESYWSGVFPDTFGREFAPVEQYVSYDSSGSGVQLCGESTRGVANAFYCPPDDAIAWDRGELLPQLQNSFGPMAPVAVLAHEMGHAVQHRAGTVADNDPVIVFEQQADCFTGAFFRHVAEGNAEHFRISTGDGLNRIMGVLSFIRDAPGTSGFTADSAHGNAFDRVTAFQYGFSDGPGRCAEMDAADVERRTTQFPFWKHAQETDLPVDDEHLEAVRASLDEVFADSGTQPPKITTDGTPCPGTRPTPPATYCESTNTVSLDTAELQRIATPPVSSDANSGYGDFAAYAQVASRYALAVQKAAGLPLDDEAAGLRTACFVGSWSGVLVEDPIGRRNPVGTLRIAPGDVDEGVAALLGEDSLIAANIDGEQVPAGFARVEAFRSGFQDGSGACAAKYRS